MTQQSLIEYLSKQLGIPIEHLTDMANRDLDTANLIMEGESINDIKWSGPHEYSPSPWSNYERCRCSREKEDKVHTVAIE